MTKVERAIKALEDLPPDRRDEVADIVLELTTALGADGSVLNDLQREEVARRRGSFQPADPAAIDRLLASLA